MKAEDTKILHDSDIREPLFDCLEERLGKIRILEEKQIGRARDDAVMVTERHLYGIEIKSDAFTGSGLIGSMFPPSTLDMVIATMTDQAFSKEW